MEPALHADTRLPLQRAEHQLTRMTVHCNAHTHSGVTHSNLQRVRLCIRGQTRCTCTAREVGNVTVFEDLRVLQHFRQPPQTRAAHYPHLRAHLRVGAQPVRRGAALLIAATDGRQTTVRVSTFCSAGQTCNVTLLQQENKQELQEICGDLNHVCSIRDNFL